MITWYVKNKLERGYHMSTNSLVWMRMKAKEGADALASFKAFVQLMEYNSATIEDPRTGFVLAYVEEVGNGDLFANLDQIDGSSELTLMGYGDGWSFERAQTLVDLFIEHEDAVLKDMLTREQDRAYVEDLFLKLSLSSDAVEFSQIVFREEDMDVQAGFDEFVWCSYEACDVPAEYNARRLANGDVIGRDEFPASRGIEVEDIPYCEAHFMLVKD